MRASPTGKLSFRGSHIKLQHLGRYVNKTLAMTLSGLYFQAVFLSHMHVRCDFRGTVGWFQVYPDLWTQ